MNGLSREMIIHPGETLREVLLGRSMSQQELAIRTGVSAKHISTVLNGEKNITVSFAKKLEYALDIDADFWINLQNSYDKELLEFDERNSISEKEISIAKLLKNVFDYLVSIKRIHACTLIEQKVLELRKILNVSNLTSIPNLVSIGAFRAQTSVAVDEYVLFAWQKICEILTENIETESLSQKEQKELVLKSIPELKSLMFKSQSQFIPEMQKLFAKCGVAFCISPVFKGAPVQGYIKHSVSGKVILCMTFRQKKADIFWFSLFHEVGHLVNGDAKQKFIDFESVENEQEKKADVFAQNCLLNKKDYEVFLRKHDFSLPSIKKFSAGQNVFPCIVIGRLKKEKYLKWSDFPHENLMYTNS